MEPRAGTCGWCGNLLDGRSDKQYCNASHRRQAKRKRKQDRERSNSLSPSGQSYAHAAEVQAADDRFRAMLAQDAESRTPNALEAEWRAWERRNPGIAHPGRAAARMARGTEARAQDWAQGTSRFIRPGNSIADQARASRAQQIRPAYVPGSGPDFDDVEQAEMIDIGNFRRGRKF